MCHSSRACCGGWTWAEDTFSLPLSLPHCPLSSHPPHLFGSPYSICMFASAVISSLVLFFRIHSWTSPVSWPRLLPWAQYRGFPRCPPRPLPSVRPSPCEKTSRPDWFPPASLLPRWAPTHQPPAVGGEGGPLNRSPHHNERDSRCLPLPQRRGLRPPPAPDLSGSAPHGPSAADRLQGLVPAPWVSAGTICQSSKDPPPVPLSSHASSMCILFCFYGFWSNLNSQLVIFTK